jgi:radical SAM superfamily enzyme YgiQ (UPF0313 family)
MCSRRSMRLPLSLLSLAAVLEGRYEWEILDGNRLDDLDAAIAAALQRSPRAVAAISVMPGPQVAPAIAASLAIRARRPDVPIVWGGYFPSLYADAAINAPYVDYVARGAGEDTLLELLAVLPDADGASASSAVADDLGGIAGLTWKNRERVEHNAARPFVDPDARPPLPYHRLEGLPDYLRPTYMGARTAVHQAAIGCRYRCSFCGVVSVYNGHTRLGGPARLEAALRTLRDGWHADAVQFYDNNFFDHEDASVPLLEVLERAGLPSWCYARADTMAKFSASTWALVRRSGLRMAYIGAEAGSDAVLRSMKKGTRVEHTLEVAARCREAGVVPEFSFVLGGPEDPEAEIERTFAFIRQVKRLHPQCDVVLYFYSPTPQRDRAWADRDVALLPSLATYGPDGPPLPTTPEEWTQPQWIRYVCHQDAPWLSSRMRQRVQDFAQVLGCRFPTVQDHRTPAWGRSVLAALASWRYASGVYGRPIELDLARRLIPLKRPEIDGL